MKPTTLTPNGSCSSCSAPVTQLETYCKKCGGKPVYNIVECESCRRPRIEGQPKRCMCDRLGR